MARDDVTPNYPAQELADAVRSSNKDTALRLLEDARGACKTRDLGEAAKRAANSKWSWPGVDYSINLDRMSWNETLTLFQISSSKSALRVVGITQPEC